MTTLELSKAQSRSISNYGRMGIDIDVVSDDTVRIIQSRLMNGYILNQKQLVERAREVFPGKEWKIIPVVYSLDVDGITLEWIEAKMEEFDIKRNDLIKQLAIDKSSLSSLFSGDRGLTKGVKAALFFYFLTYELNAGFREASAEGTLSKHDVEINKVKLNLIARLVEQNGVFGESEVAIFSGVKIPNVYDTFDYLNSIFLTDNCIELLKNSPISKEEFYHIFGGLIKGLK